MTNITDLPNEILQLIADKWTPDELYSLMLTSKKCNDKFGANTGITRVIIDNIAKQHEFAMYDDKIRNFYLRNVLVATEKSDLSMLKLMIEVHKKHYIGHESSEKYQFFANQLILRNIWANDADSLLQQIITYHTESFEPEEWITKLTPKLADLTLLPEFLGRCDAKNTRRTFEMSLKLFNTHISTIFAFKIPLITDATIEEHKVQPLSMNNWYSFLEALLYCKKKYPELLTFDLNSSNYDKDPVPPLGLAARAANPEVFDLFLKNGAAVDSRNYIEIAYEKLGIKASRFIKHLMAKGCNINAPVQSHELPYSLLAVYQNKRLTQYKWIIEDLLMKGAKLLPDEEKIFLMDEPGSERHQLALHQKQKTSYKLITEKLNGFQFLLRLKALGIHPTFTNFDLSVELIFTEHNKLVIKTDLEHRSSEWKMNGSIIQVGDDWRPDYRLVLVKLYDGKLAFIEQHAFSSNNVDLTKLWVHF